MRRPQQSRAEAHLLAVDDGPNVHGLLASFLRLTGFEVPVTGGGNGTLKTVEKASPDLVVLDVILPDMDGFTVARRLRERGVATPILFLTARDDMTDKVQGLTVGGDNHIIKSFGLEEVIARIRTILRRTHAIENQNGDVMRVAGLILDEDTHEVYHAEVEVSLSPTEFKLLHYLMLSAGRVVSEVQILDHVWEYDWNGDAAIVESYVSYLHRKVDQIQNVDGQPVTSFTQTRRGVGYMLHEPRAE